MKNKKTVSQSLSVLGPAYFFNAFLGFVPAKVKSKNVHDVDHNGLFRYAPLLMLPNLFIQLVTIFFLYDSTVKVLILQRVFLWTALLLLYIEIYYLFINWVFSMKDYIRVFNEAHRLLGRRRSNRLSAVDMLPFLTTYGYVLKPIVLPGNFVDWPSLNLLLYVRLFAQLSVESVAFAAMRAAEVVLRDLNRDLGLGNISLQEVAATWFRVNEFVKGVSRTIGTLYFPVVLMTVFLVIAGNLAALKPIMSNGIDKRVGMYVIEWSGPLCSIFVVCRRSQAVFVQVTNICKLIDENKLYLKAEESVVYDSGLWLMIMNLIFTNMLALWPGTTSVT